MLEFISFNKKSQYYQYKVTEQRLIPQFIEWAQTFPYFIQLDSKSYYKKQNSPYCYHKYENISALSFQKNTDILNLTSLKEAVEKDKAWYFGYFSYDLKNQLYKGFKNQKQDLLDFDALFFFKADLLIYKQQEAYILESLSPMEEELINEIYHYKKKDTNTHLKPIPNKITTRIDKAQYIKDVEAIQEHIQKGNIYELNYCQEFFQENISHLDAWSSFQKLTQISPTPFSVFLKQEDKFVISASPERYLCKRGQKLISQPIKGTIKMGSSEEENKQLELQLKNDPKEQSENVMIVDLVRNDLSRTAQVSSVKVEELMGIYPFKNLYQMISTVSSELRNDSSIKEIIETSFPMGSMTGAPKRRAMEIAEEFEAMKRGLYSGAIGYIDPDEAFDFNVVIRSLLYNASSKYLSFCTGSAITIQADAEKEYEECLLKAESIMLCLKGDEKI